MTIPGSDPICEKCYLRFLYVYDTYSTHFLYFSYCFDRCTCDVCVFVCVCVSEWVYVCVCVHVCAYVCLDVCILQSWATDVHSMSYTLFCIFHHLNYLFFTLIFYFGPVLVYFLGHFLSLRFLLMISNRFLIQCSILLHIIIHSSTRIENFRR